VPSPNCRKLDRTCSADIGAVRCVRPSTLYHRQCQQHKDFYGLYCKDYLWAVCTAEWAFYNVAKVKHLRLPCMHPLKLVHRQRSKTGITVYSPLICRLQSQWGHTLVCAIGCVAMVSTGDRFGCAGGCAAHLCMCSKAAEKMYGCCECARKWSCEFEKRT
jgi:hypothetical protein